MQNAGRLQAFETLDTSVCDRQHITRFPDEFASPEPFDLIVDDRGPLYYVKLEDCGTQNDGTRNAIELLSPKGLLYVAHHDPMCGRASGIRDALGNTFADALFIQGAPELLVVREQHQLYLALRRCVDRRQPEDERGIRQLGWKHNMRDVVLEACNE